MANGYGETMVTDPDTGLCANARYGFGKLTIEDFGDDPLLDEEEGWDGEDAKEEAVEIANERARKAEGRYSSVRAAVRGLTDAGYAADEANELEW